ncbi:hypothetical protein GCM10027589_09530 [Actinocorallia lasiicapitis]
MIRKVALLAAAGSIALAGCGAGVKAGSAEPTQLTEGVNHSANGIDARNIFVLGPASGQTLPAGSDLYVYGNLINNASNTSDALKSVSAAPFATSAILTTGSPVPLPAHGLINLGGVVVLKGVTAPVKGGEHVKLTFSFNAAQSFTLNVPVVPAQSEYATLTPAPTGTASGAPTVAPSTGEGLPSATPSAKKKAAEPTPAETPAGEAGH